MTTTDQFTTRRGGLTALLDFAAASHSRAAIALVVLSLLAFTPGFFQVPAVDRDEARFAQATKQMIETGDYLDVQFQNQVRHRMPIGVYWLQAAAVKGAEAIGVPRARTKIWLYRLPSLIGAIGAVLLTYWTALAFVSRRASVLAAGILATSLLLAIEARLAKTDGVLLLTVVAAMGALARIYLTARRKPGGSIPLYIPAIFWTALAAGILVKGPVIVFIAALTALTLCLLDRSWQWLRDLRPLLGIVWCSLLVMPWFALMLSHGGDIFSADALRSELLQRIFRGVEGHGAPPGYYLVLFWVTFWPGAILTGLAAPTAWRARREPGAQFLLAWLVPAWLCFEIAVTKIPHYVLPLYPAAAILIAGVVERGGLTGARWMQYGLVGWLVVPATIAIIALTGFVALAGELGFLAWPFAAGAIIMGLFAWRLFDLDGAERSLLRAFVASILLAMTVFGVLVPSATSLFPSVSLASAIRSSECGRPLAAAAGYYEPSLVFLLGTTTRLTDAAGAADFLRDGPCRFAILEGRNERIFAQHAEALGLRYAPVTRIEAFNFSLGRPAHIAVFRSADE